MISFCRLSNAERSGDLFESKYFLILVIFLLWLSDFVTDETAIENEVCTLPLNKNKF